MAGESESGMVRVSLREGDPLRLFIERLPDSDEWTWYYNIPAHLVEAHEAATAASYAAAQAIEEYIRDHSLWQLDPADEVEH